MLNVERAGRLPTAGTAEGIGAPRRDDEQARHLHQRVLDVHAQTVGEIVVGRIAGQIAKGQDHDRRSRYRRQADVLKPAWNRQRAAPFPHPQGAGDVLDLVFAEVMELSLDAVAHLAECVFGQHDAAGLGQRLQPCCDVDPVSVNVVTFHYDVADMHPDAKPQRLLVFGHPLPLPAERAFHGVDDAGELSEIAIPHALDDAAPVAGDGRFDDAGLVGLERPQRSRLILAH